MLRTGTGQRRHRERGSALTEFVLVAPLFVVLLFWAEFFVDLGVVRLKLDEAARYAIWEMTAQRNEGEVQNEIAQRFADLASPATINRDRPAGVRSFRDVGVQVAVSGREPAPFSGNIPRPQLPGFLGIVAGMLTDLLNSTVGGMLNRSGLPIAGKAVADVTFSVQNSLFPGGQVLGIFFDSGVNRQLNLQARGTPMMVNTWKAWPGKYWDTMSDRTLTNVGTDVYDTYPRTNANQASPVERIVAGVLEGPGRSNGVAFMGGASGGLVSTINTVISFLGFPKPMDTGTWADRQGPIAILPMAQPNHAWVPGYNAPQQRLGRDFHSGTDYLRPQGTRYYTNSDEYDIDRSRYTVPGRINTMEWRGRGGYARTPTAMFNAPMRNPYLRMLNCRDAFYMGSRRAQISQWEPFWTSRAYPGCW